MRASDRYRGPAVSQQKAAAIVRAGGTIYALAVDDGGRPVRGFEARVEADFNYRTSRDRPMNLDVSWTSLSRNDPAEARLHAECVIAAATVGELAEKEPQLFTTAPGWVHSSLAGLDWTEEDVAYDARRRYIEGDVEETGAWEYAVAQVKRRGEGL